MPSSHDPVSTMFHYLFIDLKIYCFPCHPVTNHDAALYTHLCIYKYLQYSCIWSP
jgi:hypothetical protein